MPKPSVNLVHTALSGLLVSLPAVVGHQAGPFDGMLPVARQRVLHSIMHTRQARVPRRRSRQILRDATFIEQFFTSHAWSIRRVNGAAVRRRGVWHCRIPRYRLRARTIP